MKYLIRASLGLIFLAACSGTKVPKDIIQRDDMVSFLVDVQLAEGYIFSFLQDSLSLTQQSEALEKKSENGVVKAHIKQKQDSLSQQIKMLRQRVDNFYVNVYKKHHVSDAQFNKSLQYYSNDLELLDSIYTLVNINLKQMNKAYNK